MTRRLLYPNTWAEGGTATDPDLDTTAPSYEPNKYETKGWHAEKPPEEWQNFITQITDLKVLGLLLSGIAEKDASVTYQDGALYKYSGKVYTVVGGVGREVLSLKESEFVSFVTNLNSTLSAHLNADNPHQDTVNTLVDKSYIKSDVDDYFGSATDPLTIVYHMNRTGSGVHGETPSQLGILPVAGGTFTGPVVMEQDAILNLSPSKVLHLNRSTAILELASGTAAIGIASNGRCWFTDSSGTYEIMTQDNYYAFQISWNNLFALPLPQFDMRLISSLSDAEGVGPWELTAENNPIFHANGGVQSSGNGDIAISGLSISANCTIVVQYRNSTGTRIVSVADSQSANFGLMATLLSAMNIPTTSAVYVERVTVYERLNAYQKSTLVR